MILKKKTNFLIMKHPDTVIGKMPEKNLKCSGNKDCVGGDNEQVNSIWGMESKGSNREKKQSADE